MEFLSNLIMSKRKRDGEYRDIIIILRGVPGTGKTTASRRLYDMFAPQYEHYVQCVSRDDMRMCYCRRHGFDYQASFREPALNTIIRDEFYQGMFTRLQHYRTEIDVPTVTIIDATNTKIADLKMTFWIIKQTSNCCKKADIYLYTKRHEHGSIHSVPECIMQRFREEIEESDGWLKANSHDYKFKMVSRVCLK